MHDFTYLQNLRSEIRFIFLDFYLKNNYLTSKNFNASSNDCNKKNEIKFLEFIKIKSLPILKIIFFIYTKSLLLGCD